ncbi:MAG TPA: Crp/Fnr family transcriptional regulator [Burkholderiaceae bacterium]|jgi:CRP-like cAMP-binding protein|nr:Crp/Fnr family transcriptional regulator [Burkholderiaceae bacterium]
MKHGFLQQREKYKAQVMRYYGVSEQMYDAINQLMAPLTTPISVRKGELLQRCGVVAQSFHWIYSGVARAGFVTEGGTEVTLRFWTEGDTVASHEDLLRARDGLPARQFVVAETALHGFRLEWADLGRMAEEHEVVRAYYIKVSEASILRQGRRIYTSSAASAQARLAAFREEYPGLEARVSQKVVASFLGITPQYMSQLLRHDTQEKVT